jgi:hypothetical protein
MVIYEKREILGMEAVDGDNPRNTGTGVSVGDRNLCLVILSFTLGIDLLHCTQKDLRNIERSRSLLSGFRRL